MRIGLVVPGFSADPGDWCIPALRHLARSLATADDLRVMTIRYPYRASRYPIDGAQVISLGGALRHGPGTLDLWRTALDVLRFEHRRRPFDVLHGFWATESGLLAAMAGRLLRVPTLVSLAGGELVALRDITYGDQRLAWERLKVGASLRLASGVSAGSRQLACRATAHVANRRSVRLAPLGVDLNLFTPAQTRSCVGDPHLLHVGTLTPVKDQAGLLRALARLRAKGVAATLEIVGDGPLRSPLAGLAHELGLENDVCFRGDLDHANLPSVYRAADACVVSSRHEAQCMVALEAAACGVPVAGTHVGVIPEITPAVARVGDPNALADAILAAISEPGTSMSQAEVRATFGLDACTARFRQLYRALIAA
jgi:glycosyltransferase involved in cell wall biosynthesis